MNFAHTLTSRSSDLDHLSWLSDLGLESFTAKSCLDLGCGTGYLSERQALAGATNSIGVDVVEVKFVKNTTLSTSSSLRYLTADLNQSSWFPSGQKEFQGFDLITAFDILEHLDSPWNFVLSCKALLKNGGSLVLTTPNVSGWERRLRPGTWSGGCDPQHKVLFTPYTLGFLLERAGFKLEHVGAPIRKLGSIGKLVGPVGGQIVARASVVKN